jgi:vesicle transport protein SEC22
LNDELYGVHQIITRNVQEVLGEGEKLEREFHTVILCSLRLFVTSLYFLD